MDGQPRRVGHQAAQGDLLGPRVLALRHLPALQLHVDVFVERQGAVLHQVERGGGRHGLADRAGLKERPRGDRRPGCCVREAVGPGLGDPVAVDDGKAEPRHLVEGHHLLQAHPERGFGRTQGTSTVVASTLWKGASWASGGVSGRTCGAMPVRSARFKRVTFRDRRDGHGGTLRLF